MAYPIAPVGARPGILRRIVDLVASTEAASGRDPGEAAIARLGQRLERIEKRLEDLERAAKAGGWRSDSDAWFPLRSSPGLTRGS